MGVRWHLPGVVLPVVRDPLHGFQRGPVMVTACGKRGPIRLREDIGAFPVQATFSGLVEPEPSLVCDGCMVAWDYAEENGLLVHVLAYNPKRQWSAGGAPLVSLEGVTCQTCGGRNSWSWKMTPLAAVPRARRA